MNKLGCTDPISKFTVKEHIIVELWAIDSGLCVNFHRNRLSNMNIRSFIIPVFIVDEELLINDKNKDRMQKLAAVIRYNPHIASLIPIIFPKQMEEQAFEYVDKLKHKLLEKNIKTSSKPSRYTKIISPLTRLSLSTYLLIFSNLKGNHKVYVENARAWKPFEEAVNAAANIFWTSKVSVNLAYELLQRPTGGPLRPDSIALRNINGKIELLVIDAKLRTLNNRWITRLLRGTRGENIKKYQIYLEKAIEELSGLLQRSFVINIKSLMFVFRKINLKDLDIKDVINIFRNTGYDNIEFLSIDKFILELDPYTTGNS